MQKRVSSCAGVLLLAITTVVRLQAQAGDQGKPPIYTYLSEWTVARAQWPDMEKLNQDDRAIMDKLVADGTITGYGAFTNLVHQEGEPTHGTWFTATSEGNILKALEAVYAHPGSTTAPVEGASKHWDYFLMSRIYNQRSGKSEGGYLAGDQWQVKPGQMRAYTELVKSSTVPIFEKLMAEGVVTAYGMDTEDFHTGKMGEVTFYFTTPDAAAFDKASKAFDEAFDKNPAIGAALNSMVERDGHRDFLDRIEYMSNR